MKMALARRGFLRLLGGAVAAGPQVAKAAGEMTLADTSLRGMGVSASLANGLEPRTMDTSWAKEALAKLRGGGERARRMRKAQFYVDGLEPDVAGLRSMSLVHKVRITRDRQFERHERLQGTWLSGVVNGWWQA